jgi:hypothetical protein
LSVSPAGSYDRFGAGESRIMNGMQKAILVAVVVIAAVAGIWGVGVNLALRIVGGVCARRSDWDRNQEPPQGELAAPTDARGGTAPPSSIRNSGIAASITVAARIARHPMPIDERRLTQVLVAYTFLWLLIYAPLETFVTISIAGIGGLIYSETRS